MLNKIQIMPLGAGQDVGRSCVIVTINGKTIMFDCGMHMGYDDHRRFPNFRKLAPTGNFNGVIDCVIVTHFHLDHCGALPYFTEMCGYTGPLYMTAPTRAICPLLLEDYRKITVDRKNEKDFFTAEDIKNCMRKVRVISLHQTIRIDHDLEIKAYYAGHVLGAAMFYIRSGDSSVVYTGDYNMTPDRHLGAAWIDKVNPDVLITETTYATTIRDSKRARETDFLKKVHDCVNNGGKVLIPVFALGRAQELCILIESYWERMNLRIPVYFSGGMTAKANEYYKMYINWTNQKLKKTFAERNMFDFKHIRTFEMSNANDLGPQVLFASPGMLHAGFSLEVFKRWAGDSKNMVILPGYCVPGTVGAKVLAGEKNIKVDNVTTIRVNMTVKHLSFSAHADAKGIMQLIEQSGAKNVVLVHGEAGKMNVLKGMVEEKGIPCFSPANEETITISKEPLLQLDISSTFFKKDYKVVIDDLLDISTVVPKDVITIRGQMDYSSKRPKLVECEGTGVRFKINTMFQNTVKTAEEIMRDLYVVLKREVKGDIVRIFENSSATRIQAASLVLELTRFETNVPTLIASWEIIDHDIAEVIIQAVKSIERK